MNKERHHVIPISLWWINNDNNILELSVYSHREILHKTLDIPLKRHKLYNRKIRELTNGYLVIKPDAIDMIGDIQREFLHNMHRLPSRLIQEHVKTMMRLINDQRENFLRITWEARDKPKFINNKVDLVHSLHNQYTECRKDCSKAILDILKTHIAT
jgi:hypothetical protein